MRGKMKRDIYRNQNRTSFESGFRFLFRQQKNGKNVCLLWGESKNKKILTALMGLGFIYLLNIPLWALTRVTAVLKPALQTP